MYRCARCDREFELPEGRIGDDWYCHPDDLTLPDCYTLACHEQVAERHVVKLESDDAVEAAWLFMEQLRKVALK